ncbi:protein lifeguard 1-like [Amphibalanus amphitrite]|nr:protein lifeguard 1-like [Amphibalanus amphitrite]XP_043196654.1 protein lifeguard 1-like [Amphibalanus amphitrite]XP_043196655.1 protein lifeguard 1-like [Amphibalanus amphitrite]XP_043196657.1 protein lifeguard 1-like [Amphibalanus amphitrite]XP_043196658.1 protein lifeguard 1-like [Amphibalanus amphitrite]XP_043196659.1 protein lifeguard 1-like [Amphibalanus amphitrite]XP_043196660.1 protein lifeguard 1-like [Amphibalanus amphitrite]XP_043196661.1 protein lifeguard 1-like [Amphibalanus
MQQPSAPPPPYYGGAADDFHEPLTGSAFDFNEQTVRKGFIRKVYSILMAQLAVTAGIIAIFFAESVREYAVRNQWIFWVAFAGTFACILTLACCEDMRRKTPHNFIFLGVFTVCEGVLLGCACASFKASEVLMAVGICTVVCLALTMFAFQTKYDFTMLNGILFVCLIVLMVFGLFAMIFPGKVISLVYASLGALLFSVYLVVDTQMMMGGKHKYTISPEEYIFAALNLYLDIINLFLYILQIVAAANRN